MSFLTGTNVEVIAASSVAGTAQNTFTAAQVIGNGSNAAYLPIGFFNTNSLGKTLKIVADGIYSTTGSPTLQLGVSLDTTFGTVSSTTFATGAVTAGTTVTNAWWHFDIELTVQSLTEVDPHTSATGTVANIVGLGTAIIATSATATTAQSVLTMGSTSPATGANIFSAQFLEIYAAWGTSSASNTITLERSTVYGCN